MSKEEIAPKNKLLVTLLAGMVAGAFGLADNASAAKKLTYDQAYAKCKSIMDKEGTLGTSTQANVRYTRGAACMKKCGYTFNWLVSGLRRSKVRAQEIGRPRRSNLHIAPSLLSGDPAENENRRHHISV